MEEGKGKKKGKAQNVEVINEEPSDEEEFYLSDEEGARVDGIYIPPPQKPTLSFDHTGPRLIITKIENNFFKSYAEHQVLGPFHKCFNAIVGPNGSGKSNVIDSLLFVFGYRATKIRCKKVSVLLHNSENYRNVQTCTVAIYFALIIDKEGDNYDIVPGSEFVISRTANKDNSSYYELNRKRAQFKDIAVILKKHGVDLDHNRFLILQGEVEQIAMMKCKGEKEGESGMLEYLEGIIGTSRYKKPLEQVHERVEILAELRTEKLNRLKIVENELEELRGPMEEAVGFLKAENTIVRSKNFLYQKSIKDMKSKVEIEKHSHDEVLEVQKTFIEKLKALEDQKKEHMETQNKEAKIYENLKKKKETIKEAFDKANKKDIQLQADMMNKIETRKKTKEQIAEEKKKLIKLESVPEESEKNIEEYEAKRVKTIATNEKHEAEKEVLLKNIQSETQGLQAEKEEILKELAVLKEGVNRTKSAFNLAETELKVCISNEENEKGKLADLQKLASTSKVTIEERTQQVVELKRKIPATEKILNETNVELLQVKQEEANLINTIRSKRASLEEVKSSMQASRSSGRVLDSLMQAKRDGKCPGLFGRLGDLGDIDSKYDVAVSTACGPLDNIVVDTVDCAQWCIEFLKKHAIGRGVFIALEKQEHLRQSANSTIQTPENVRRLYDLIKVKDERVKTAFYYALRDTLVADDLDQATRIAYGARRYRVVTLKGDLIETTGTMSGGGKRMLRGRMGQSLAVANVDPRELQRMEGELETLESRVRELRQTQSTLEVQISELQPQLRQMKIDYEKYNQELQSLRQQQPDLARQVKEQEVRSKATKADAGQVQKLTAIVAQRKQEYDAAAEKAGFLQVKVDQLTKEIKDKSTGKIRAVDKQIKECTKIIEQCKTEIVRMKVAVKTAERNYNTTKENIARMEQDVEEMENSLRAMKQDREEIKEDAKKFLTSIEEITEQLGEREKVFLGAQKTVDKITKQENQLKSDKIDVDEKLKGHQKKLKEYNATVHAWEAKLSHLKLQEITNETIEDLKQYTDDELEQRNAESTEKELQAAENLLKVAKPNLNAIQEYSKIQTVYMERTKELEEITAKRTEMRKIYDNLRSRRKEEFLTGYNIIKLKLKEMYQMITLGGDAEFELVDTYDPFAEGIQFNVRPPRKTWKKISNLSGGEKTLSSLALVFALHYYKPSPLYVMDEIDAALDFKNVSIVGNYIKERTKNAQFIIISLHSNMFELCDNLVGIYKTYNTTKTITINPRIYDKPPAQPVVQSAFDLNRRPDRETRENRDTNQPNAVSVNQDKQQGSGDTGQTLFDDEGGPAISSSEIDKLKTENMELSLKIKELRVQLSAVLLDKTGLHEKLLILQNANEALSKKLLELREQYNVTFTRISIGVENNDVQSIKDNLGRLKEIQDHFNVLQKDQIKTENEIRDHEETFTIIVHTAKNAGETPREIQEKEESHTTRQMFLNSELEEISKKLLLKEQLAKQLVTNTRYMVDEQALMDTQKKIENLEKEKEELLQQLRNVKTQENSNKLAEQRRKRMQELEQQLKDLKKVSEQSRLIKLREKDEQKIKQLNQEITSMKSAKVKLLKQMREETDRYRNWRQQTEKELARVKQQDRKKETEIAKMKVMHEKQKNLLKRKFEEAAALNKRLQSTLMKRKQAEETRFTGKVEKISSWLEEELDIYVYLVEADTTLAGLLEDRATLKHQLDELKNNPEMAASSEIKTIEVDIELRSVQIQDLQPKLLDSDEENKAKTRFDAIQTMAEAKYALRTLFDQAAEFRKKEVSTKREMSEIRDSHKELLDKIDQLTKDMKSMEDNYSEQLANHERASQEKVGILLMQMRGIKNEDVSPESELLRRCQIQDERIAHQESIIEEQEKTISGLKKRLEDIEKTSRAAITPVPQKVMKEKVANNQVTDSTFVEEHEVRSADETDDVFDDIENDPDWRKTPLAKRIIAERKNNKLLRVDQMNNNTKDSMTGTKRSPTGGCTCRTNCSTVRCGCRKLGRGCSTFCKCNETACRNRHDDEVSSMECGRDSANPTTSDIATDDSDNTFKKPRFR